MWVSKKRLDTINIFIDDIYFQDRSGLQQAAFPVPRYLYDSLIVPRGREIPAELGRDRGMGRRVRTWKDVLRYSYRKQNRQTVRRHYEAWRREHNIAHRCDNPNCFFHWHFPVWNGKPLPLILDHVNGNPRNNTPGNLRFLCANCDSQLPTRGGKNIGHIQNENEQGYEILFKDGRRDADVFISPLAASPGLCIGGPSNDTKSTDE